MLITLTCNAPNAHEIGYLLGKNPTSVYERAFSAGTVWVFYPEVTDERITVALLTEIDPIGLVRGPSALTQLDQYVNDRPYVASSLVSVALNTAFSSALAGKSRELPERVGERMRWEVALPAVACDAGDELMTKLFAPLGYTLTTTRLPLDPRFPAWGQSQIYALRLEGAQTVRDLLSHLYVLLPVLDNSKHYFVGTDETDKLLAHGAGWLQAHPERELIARRYLRYKQTLVQTALTWLLESDETRAPSEIADVGRLEAPEALDSDEVEQGVYYQRLNALRAAVRNVAVHSQAVLWGGAGRLG